MISPTDITVGIFQCTSNLAEGWSDSSSTRCLAESFPCSVIHHGTESIQLCFTIHNSAQVGHYYTITVQLLVSLPKLPFLSKIYCIICSTNRYECPKTQLLFTIYSL